MAARSAAGWRQSSELLDAAERAFEEAADEPYEPSVGRAASLVANVPAAIAFWRGYLAELGGDAERAITFDAPGPGRARRGRVGCWTSVVRLAPGAWPRWLSGRLPEAERAFVVEPCRS